MLNLVDRLGDFNPQLLRELKGRLTGRSVLAVLSLSIVAQILLLLWFYTQLPIIENNYQSSVLNWSWLWQRMERTLNIGIAFLLMVTGTYFLLSDLQNEERQRTLDFVRLSPRSASSILLGKIFGVPILMYGAIASLLPLHLFVILKAGHPLSFFLSFYTLIAAGAYLIFSLTLLFGFFSKSMLKRSAQTLGVTILYVLFVAAIFVPGYLFWNTETVWKALLKPASTHDLWVWFGLPISQNATIAHLFMLVNIAILSGWIWQGLIRCFHQPHAMMLRKRQSYGLVFYLQVLILGLGIVYNYYTRGDADIQRHSGAMANLGVMVLPVFLNLPIFLVLIAMLSPQRQAVMDWARYRWSVYYSMIKVRQDWQSC
jgi:hypothetical protein